MGNRLRYAKFHENLFSSNEISSFCPSSFSQTTYNSNVADPRMHLYLAVCNSHPLHFNSHIAVLPHLINAINT